MYVCVHVCVGVGVRVYVHVNVCVCMGVDGYVHMNVGGWVGACVCVEGWGWVGVYMLPRDTHSTYRCT